MKRIFLSIGTAFCFGVVSAGLHPKLHVRSEMAPLTKAMDCLSIQNTTQIPSAYGPIRPTMHEKAIKRKAAERIAKCLKTMRKIDQRGLDSVNLGSAVSRIKYLLKQQDVSLADEELILVRDVTQFILDSSVITPYLCIQEFQRDLRGVKELLKQFKSTHGL